ncbi:MAG: aspartate aminotransferase family protein, partial [Phycisphaeraceae bacterium]|nr:aspartate aminotransferase family protein [Phycisphaeraceae bacterium]
REKIIRCGYHGWHPWTQPGRTGIPGCYRDLTLEVDYNDLDQIETHLKRNPGQIAGIIVEAVRDHGPQRGYFDGVRHLCDEHGAVFILDEVKTGFRFALGGAQATFGIEPDLATFGKAMCNGYPGSVVVGRRSVMAGRIDTYLAATFHADALTIAAALTTIRTLEEQDGIAHQWRLGQRLMDGLTRIFTSASVELEVVGFPVLASVAPSTTDWARLRVRFIEGLIARGVYMTTHPWFLSLAHTNADIDLVLERAELALKDALT